MQFGCIGERLPHSFSKIIHEKIGGYDYSLKELTPKELEPFMLKREFCGINVTIPYKEKVIPYLDDVSDTAKKIGAVNTVINRNGKLYGYNTDYIGMKMLAEKTGITFSSKTVLILGTGGTAKTATAVAKDGGAKSVFKVSRTPSCGAISYDDAYKMKNGVDVIINTTPCGMFPNVSTRAIDISEFNSLSGVLDVVYNPLKTNLVLQAEQKNVPTSGGLYMLVGQAVSASEIFTGNKCTYSLTEKITAEILKDKRNVVLIGMPSVGKTTIGLKLAKITGRTLIDTDEEILKEYGKSPAEIIKNEGIAKFRSIESEIITEISALQGVIVATGGGAVLDIDNVKALKRNGVTVWLDRPVQSLISTKDRPLSDTSEKLESLYLERLPVYRKTADIRVDASGTANDTLKTILESNII